MKFCPRACPPFHDPGRTWPVPPVPPVPSVLDVGLSHGLLGLPVAPRPRTVPIPRLSQGAGPLSSDGSGPARLWPVLWNRHGNWSPPAMSCRCGSWGVAAGTCRWQSTDMRREPRGLVGKSFASDPDDAQAWGGVQGRAGHRGHLRGGVKDRRVCRAPRTLPAAQRETV